MGKFNERLKALRKARNISQQALADEVGISKSSINMYERGEREPSFETMESIADYFNVDMNYLTGWSDDPTNYDDPLLIASIPLNYIEACDGDLERAYQLMLAVDQDAQEECLEPVKLRSIELLEKAVVSPEQDREIANYIEYVLAKKN